MESAFMARKDERSTRLRQASGTAAAQHSTVNAEFSQEVPAFHSRCARGCGKPDLRNIVSIVILCDLRVKVGTRG